MRWREGKTNKQKCWSSEDNLGFNNLRGQWCEKVKRKYRTKKNLVFTFGIVKQIKMVGEQIFAVGKKEKKEKGTSPLFK